MRAYSDYVIRGLGLQAQTHYAQPRPSTTVTVTYMARRASSEWPEKKFCSDTESFFLCRLWADWGVRRLGRMVSNDAEVVKALKGLEGKTFPNGAQVCSCFYLAWAHAGPSPLPLSCGLSARGRCGCRTWTSTC